MYIREVLHKNRKNNTQYSTFKLVESSRTQRGPRQYPILNFGSTFDLPKEQWKVLANRIEQIVTGQNSLFEFATGVEFGVSKEIEELAQRYAREIIRQKASIVPTEKAEKEDTSADYEPEYHNCDINSLKNEEARTVGAEHVVYETVKELGLDQKLTELGLDKTDVNAAIGVIGARLINPSSERATHTWLKQVSAIDELMNTDFSQLSQDRVYKVSDKLLKHKERLEEYLSWKEQDLFNLQEKIILYDLTNTFFEGSGKYNKYNKKAQFGRSKEKRSDCPLVTLGLVLNGEGFPKKSKVFEGNASEPKTFKEMIAGLSSKRILPIKPTIVMDAGIATEDNIKWLKEMKEQYNYLVVSRKRKKDIPEGINLVTVKNDNRGTVQAGIIRDDACNETVVYCHSTGKGKKEKSIKSLFMQRFEEELKKAHEALSKKGGTKCYDKVVERIGRLKEKFKRVARYYTVTTNKDTETNKATAITYHQKETESKKEGVYCLRTNLSGFKEEEIWNTYRMLNEIEDAFCAMKSELGLRPVCHQTEDRISGHLFITVLAYHILHAIRFKLQRKEINHDWTTIRDFLSTHVRITTTMKTKEGKMIHIRKSCLAESHQKKIYNTLNLSATPGKTTKTII